MEEIDIKSLLKLLWMKKILIITCIIISTIAGYIINTKIIQPEYEATTTIILSVDQKTSGDAEIKQTVTSEEIKLSENLMDTYTEIINSETLLNTIKENLNLNIEVNDLRKSIKLKQQSGSVVFKINVKNKEAETAAKIANEIPEVFFAKIRELYNISNAQVLDVAKTPTAPCNVHPVRSMAIGAAIGFMISIIVLIISSMFNDKITAEQEIEEKIKVPVLSKMGQVSEKEKYIIFNRNSACSEAFRVLVSNIKYLGAKTIYVTSNSPGEGKSWVSANMAVTYAKSGKKTLLIDADIRKGTQHLIFSNQPFGLGISDLIDKNPKEINFDKYVTRVINNLDLITRGTVSIDYSKMLYTNALENLIEMAKERYDFIIIDGTPASLVADDVALAKAIDSTLVVVRYNKTTANDVKKIKSRVERSGGKILGVVLNGIPKLGKKYEYDYYGYSSSKQMVAKQQKDYGRDRTSKH